MWLGTSILSNKHSEYTKLDYVAVLPGQAVAICKPSSPWLELYTEVNCTPGHAAAAVGRGGPGPLHASADRGLRASMAGAVLAGAGRDGADTVRLQ